MWEQLPFSPSLKLFWSSYCSIVQGFWYFARSQTCEFQVNPWNPAQFTKTREIPRNSQETLPNTCRYNIFESYLGCWGCLLAVNLLTYLETSSPQRVNNIPKLPGVLRLMLRKTGKQQCKNPGVPSVDHGNWRCEWELVSYVHLTRVQNVCTCARSLFSKRRLRMRTSQQERLFSSWNRTLLASKTSKQETLNHTGARISRKFAVILQESRSFRQIRASPFSVFIFDFRMKRKRVWTFKHDFRLWCKEESMRCKRETGAINTLCVREILSLSFVCGAYFFNFAAGI